MWETAYIGAGALLTGRFNQFGMTTFNFDEANPANTNFEAWVRLNTVNTGEPGRDAGCLLGTFGTALGKVDEAENIAKIKSKSIELSTTDKGYIVKCDLTFHGVTKEVTAKMNYTGKTTFPAGYAGATALTLAGLNIEFQFFAKTDFAIVSNNIADKVTIKCNGQFKKS
jgi:polyisoprenoid-binding protein YceI